MAVAAERVCIRGYACAARAWTMESGQGGVPKLSKAQTEEESDKVTFWFVVTVQVEESNTCAETMATMAVEGS